MFQESFKLGDIEGARSAAKAAIAAFQECNFPDGISMAVALEEQADTLSRMQQALNAALEGSEALQAARTSLRSGQLVKARNNLLQAKTMFALEDLKERQSKSIETLAELEKELEVAESKVERVREGLSVSTFTSNYY